jgi:hypothetical protein
MKREVVPKELLDKSSTSPNPVMDVVVFINLSLFRGVQMKKMRYSKAPSSFHSNASRTNEFEDPSKELRKH